MDSVINFLKTAGVDLLRGLLVLAVGFFLVYWINKLLRRNKKLMKIEPTLRGFLLNLIRVVLSVLVVLTAVNIMGIPMTSILTLVASGGVAIGEGVAEAIERDYRLRVRYDDGTEDLLNSGEVSVHA